MNKNMNNLFEIKKLFTGILVLLVIVSISIVSAKTEKKIEEKGFFDGMSKKEIENIIEGFSSGPMYYFARIYGIDSIRGKKLNFDFNTSKSGDFGTLYSDSPIGTSNKWEYNPSIAAKPTDPNIIVAAFLKYPYPTTNYDFRCIAYRSLDKGETWIDSVQLPLLPGTQCSNPVVRWAPDGSKVYASYLLYNNTYDSVVVSRSLDNGKTWSAPKIAISSPYPNTFVDNQWMDVHPFWINSNTTGKLYITASRYIGTGSQILFSRSANGGISFSSPIILASTSNDRLLHGPRPIGGKSFSSISGDVLVCWYDSRADGEFYGTFDIKCKLSTNYGSTFGSTLTAVNNKTELPYYLDGPTDPSPISYGRWWPGMLPSILISYDGVAHIVFTADPVVDRDYGGEAGNIYYVKSPRPYTNWTPARTKINDDDYNGAQGFPTITGKRVTGGTILTVFWEDHRNSPYNTPIDEDCGYGIGVGHGINCYYDIYSASTSPGGTDWNSNPNKRVTDVSSMSHTGLDLGDYIDSSSNRVLSDMTAHTIWSDRSDISNVHTEDTDVYSDRIDISNH